MSEKSPYVYLTNLPKEADRKFLLNLFAPFGPIRKMYVSPAYEFAKVYLDSEELLAAYDKLKQNRYNIKLNVFIPPSHEIASSKESSNSTRPDTSFNAYRPKRYTPHEMDVDTSVAQNYVDVFGRVVTTLHDDDGDVYVSLTELKKSGFELFQHGSLPIRNSSIVYDEQKLTQFELYMKMKAAKFMSSHNFHVSDMKVNSIIEKEKNDYFDIQEHVTANSTMRMPLRSSRRDTAEGFRPSINKMNQGNNENNQRNFNRRSRSTTSSDNRVGSSSDITEDNKNYHHNSIFKNGNEYGNKNNQRNFKNHDQLNNSTANNIIVEVNTTTPNRIPHFKTKQINNEEMNGIVPIVRVSLPLNVDHQVSVVHVESACEGWVQLLTNKKIIQSLMDDTMVECRNSPPAKPIVNTICGALSTNIWCRAIVLCSSPLKVRYIDYGSETSANVGDLRQLSDKLISIPAQAIRIVVKDNPNIQLTQDLDLTITPTKQDHDGTYVVNVKGNRCPPAFKTSTNENRPAILPSAATSNNTESSPPLRKPRSMILKESVLKQEKKPQRKIIIEQLCDVGIFEFVDMTSTRTFTGFAVPANFSQEISVLDEITDRCKPDPKFKPNIGDIVAAHDSDSFVRGLVLSVSNGQYTCALIDYGTIKIVNEVRQLPEDFTTIPEFSFECEADPTVIEELKAVKSTTLQIKSPYMLTLTTESGITYDIVGYCWNPLQPVVLNDNRTEMQQQNIPLTKLTTELNQNSTLTVTLQRSTVIESTCDCGIFDFVNVINDTSFIAFICPDTFTTEACLLEHIGDDTVADPLFKPMPGELVAASTSDGIVRGTVLSVDSKGNYECALIDYGTIKAVEEVRKLPEKYVNIAEFAVMCTADSKIVNDIQNYKCVSLKISTPCVLTIKLESGKQYNIDGSRWIPFKSELPSNDSKLVKELKVACKNNHLQQLVPSTSKSDVSLKEEKTKTMTPLRKLVIEDCCENGYFDFIEMTSDNTFTCFTCPEKYTSVVAALDDIYKDTCFDRSFIPKEGDLVAASDSPEGFRRGVVLEATKGKYKCALIDYGTIKTVTEVRSLPQKYLTIPEFVCECEADANTIEELQNWKSKSLQIKSPYTLTITLESGKEHVVKGSHWDPLKNCLTTKSNVTQSLSTNAKNYTDPQPLTARKLVIDEICDEGIFEFTEIIDENTFVGFAFPKTFANECNQLEEINDNLEPDSSFQPNIGDLVAAPGPGGYVRAIIISHDNKRYTCALIDYGLTRKVDEIQPLPDKYKSIPEFAFQCTTDSKVVEELQKVSCKSLAINSPRSLTLHMENGSQHVLKGYRWDPLATLQSTPDKKTKQPIPVKEVKQPIMYKTPVETVLTDGDQVKIVGTQNNILLVQNKEANSLFKIVSSELSNYKAKHFEGVPQVGSLAVCNFKDDNLYRVVINKVDANIATVEYIDYGDMNSVPINNLKAISEKLACINTSVIKIHLKGFNNLKFSEDMLNFLLRCSEKEKFIARKVAGEINTYDLIGSNGTSLSEQFINAKKQNVTSVTRNEKTTPNGSLEGKHNNNKRPTSNKKAETSPNSSGLETKTLSSESVCRLHDILKCDVTIGNNQLLCLYAGYLNEANVSFCKADEDTIKLLQHVTETIPNYVQRDNKPYVPKMFEVCLVKFEGEWCRGAIIKVNDDQTYGVFYVDYGNSHVVDSSEIRKLPEELSNIKALAMHCRIEGVLKENEDTVNEPLLSRLLNDVIENQVYDVNILSIEKNEYSVIIPSLLEEWKSDGLL